MWRLFITTTIDVHLGGPLERITFPAAFLRSNVFYAMKSLSVVWLICLLFAPGALAQVPQTITFEQPLPKQNDADPFTLSATASSGLPVTFTILAGPATVAGSTVALTGVGAVTVKASQAGNASFQAAPDVLRSFAVGPAIQFTKVVSGMAS